MRVGVVGATGYVGSELCRWLLEHPRFELTSVVSTSRAGRALADEVPALSGLTDLVLQPFDERLGALDAVFLATPHGAARPLVGALDGVPLLVDASADHRHAPGWVYGQPELVGDALVGATRIAAPGCFATALELAIGPLVKAGLVTGAVTATGMTGSTGSGATPSDGTHHPLRAVNLKAYKVLSHQHVPEVRGLLAALGEAPPLHFVPHSAPVDRGILVTAFVPVSGSPMSALDDAYRGHRLVRRRVGSPELRHVRGTAFADLAVAEGAGVAVVMVAIDNLGKGAAAQAVQAANVALGWEGTTGLLRAATTP
ncbi:MAG: N-acetyl-gamma-glutamyl-phosphate reductase [Myxococcales bacterium]|nr:N-acetyl-gamma-glutamyl-phosphate reductase [Myxococcales bacterium]MCA9568322.1 N-acetyl-gamma-glutamyl-phosphate reductase [Myxococcales bacterium]